MSSIKRKSSPSPSAGVGPRPKQSRRRTTGLPSLQGFQNDLQDAAKKALPSPQPVYTSGVLITIEWSDTDIPLGTRAGLAQSMKFFYNFKHEEYVIDSTEHYTSSAFDLIQAMDTYRSKYVRSKSDRVIFIVYFTGHAFQRPGVGDIMISGKPGLKDPYFPWSNVATRCHNDSYASYLHIMDCCNAAMAYLDSGIETLAAGSWSEAAAAQSKYLFTQMIIEELSKTNGAPFTACQLVTRITYQCQSARYGTEPVYRAPRDENLSSITIHQITSMNQRWSPLTSGTRAKIVLTVKLEAEMTVPDIEAFKKWLTTSLPDGVHDIEILATWDTTSVMLLIAIPMEFWLFLRNDEAYGYVSVFQGGFRSLENEIGGAGIGVDPTTSTGNLAQRSDLTMNVQRENNPTDAGGLVERSASMMNIERGTNAKS